MVYMHVGCVHVAVCVGPVWSVSPSAAFFAPLRGHSRSGLVTRLAETSPAPTRPLGAGKEGKSYESTVGVSISKSTCLQEGGRLNPGAGSQAAGASGGLLALGIPLLNCRDHDREGGKGTSKDSACLQE
jgi:hypothetical protein